MDEKLVPTSEIRCRDGRRPAFGVRHIAFTSSLQRDCIRFFVRVAGDSMIRAGIYPGDLLIVNRSLEARDGRVIVRGGAISRSQNLGN